MRNLVGRFARGRAIAAGLGARLSPAPIAAKPAAGVSRAAIAVKPAALFSPAGRRSPAAMAPRPLAATAGRPGR